MTKLEFVDELIKTVMDEFENCENSTQFITKEGNIISADVGYALEWFRDYSEILRKRYKNMKGENDEIL